MSAVLPPTTPGAEPNPGRRRVLKGGIASVFLGLPMVRSIFTAGPAYAEPHTHCANTYARFLGSYCTTSCIKIYVWALFCWDCSGQCGATIYEIDGPC
jgi:hypothetical protein